MGEDNFKYIVTQLKNQGVTMIGVDSQLTERKIMKLADLIKEAPTLEEMKKPKWLEALKAILKEWETKTYTDDKNKWESYYMDIEDLIKAWDADLEDQGEQDEYDKGWYTEGKEEKLRKLIRKTIRQ